MIKAVFSLCVVIIEMEHRCTSYMIETAQSRTKSPRTVCSATVHIIKAEKRTQNRQMQ